MTQIVFGSAEAKEIIKKDKEITEEGLLRAYHTTVTGTYSQSVTVHAHNKEEANRLLIKGDWAESGYPEPDTFDIPMWDEIEVGEIVRE